MRGHRKLNRAHEQDAGEGPKPRVPAHARPPERNTMETIPLNRPELQKFEEPDRSKSVKQNNTKQDNTTTTLRKTGGTHQKHASEESATTTPPDTAHKNKSNRQSHEQQEGRTIQ